MSFVYFYVSLAVVLLVTSAMFKSYVLFAGGLGLFAFLAIYYKNTIVANYYRFSDSKLEELSERIKPVIPEIQYVKIYGSNKSFTINKSVCYICMKDENGNYYQDNMLIYVILHELAHALCDEVKVENSAKWESIFNDLLRRAAEGGVYDPSEPVLDNYCGYN
jgi:hypothetical protein